MRSDIDATRPLTVDDLPYVHGAGRRVEPDNVGGAVAVEIAEDRWLETCRMGADIHTAGPLAIRDFPQIHIARGRIIPKDIAGPVAVKVADAARDITGGVCAYGDA